MFDLAYTRYDYYTWLKDQNDESLRKFAENPDDVPFASLYAKVIELDRKASKVDGHDYYRNGSSEVSESYRIAYDLFVRKMVHRMMNWLPGFCNYLRDNHANVYDWVGNGSCYPHEMWVDGTWKQVIKRELEGDLKRLEALDDMNALDLMQYEECKELLEDIAYMEKKGEHK